MAHGSKVIGHEHGAGDAKDHAHHAHIIVSLFTLRTILALLMLFTLLTVGLGQAEAFVAHTFNVEIPQWMNVFIALSIATVKTTLVVMFFMQLKYDNPMNSVIFVFTLVTVVCFLGFTMLDLGQRGTLDRYKAEYIVPGGTGGISGGTLNGQAIPIVDAAVLKARNEGKYHPHAHEHDAKGGFTESGYRAHRPETGSSGNISRPVTGVTLAELGGKPADGHDHGDHAPKDGDAKQQHDDKTGEKPSGEPKPTPPGHH